MIVAVADASFATYFDSPESVNETLLMSLPRCNQVEEVPDKIQRFVCMPGTYGQFIIVFLPSGLKLVLCEVLVFSPFGMGPETGMNFISNCTKMI